MVLSSSLLAQNPVDTILLPVVHLNESRVEAHKIGSHTDIINPKQISLSRSYNLSDLLVNNTSIYIKQYGALSTPTFRGTSSSQTLVQWNGIVLNSTANGMLDFSILPVGSFDEIFIVHGGDGSVFGSGALGGSIHCNSAAKFNSKNSIVITFDKGSFGRNSRTILFNYSENKLAMSVFLNTLTDENNFEYKNTTQLYSPLQINDYGKIKSNQKQLNISYKFNDNNKLKFNYWGTQSDREVPQNMTTPMSDAKQYDDYDRLLISSDINFKNLKIQFKQAYLKEDFNYTEISKKIDSYFIAESLISDLDLKYYKNSFMFNFGGIFNNNDIENNNYGGLKKNEQNLAIFSAFQHNSDVININTVLRKEWHTTFGVPLLPTLAIESRISKYLKIRGKLNKNFRVPTFNDRFWVGSGANGNINLVPEHSWSREFGFDLELKKFNLKSTLYFMNISDMIIWQTTENGSWMPQNVNEVYSRGFESSFKVKFKKLLIRGNYCFTKSINDNPISSLDNSVGKQIRYVPLNKLNLAFDFSYKSVQFIFNHSYTDKVITSYGYLEDKYLDAFFISDLTVNTKINFIPILFQVTISNLMNKSYQTYQNYPNPGREILLTINYTIK